MFENNGHWTIIAPPKGNKPGLRISPKFSTHHDARGWANRVWGLGVGTHQWCESARCVCSKNAGFVR